MSAVYTQANLQLSVSTPLGQDKLLLRAFNGEERISESFFFNLEMLSEDNALDFSAIVGKSITVTMALSGGTDRYLNGVVTRFVQAGSHGRFTTYFADLRPWFWLLTLTADSKIFQNQTTPQIIEKVFTDLGFTDYRNALTATYQAREYCVQYQETAFAFVSRLMEDEGIHYFFEHSDGKHTLVFADDSDAHQNCPGLSEAVHYRGSAIDATDDHTVASCVLEQQVVTGKYAMDDFNFETPSTDLITSVDGVDGKLRVYEYPGGFTKKDIGEKRANVRIASVELPQKLLRGDSFCRAFTTGCKFTLKNFYRSDANASYVLNWISHQCTQESYSNSFEAVASTTTYRPSRKTPRPIIPGSQTAIVVGKSGEEIWTDKYGRIKVQFHWDQEGKNDENSSCWIRVDQGWAGKQWGGIFLPRIGQEVIVSFLEGDPDRPLVTGAVYNAEQLVPYTLPDDQTKSTIKTNSSKGEGFNEIRFEDKKDSEEIFVHAQKDMNIKVEHDRTKNVLHDEVNTIKNSRTTTIQEADESLTVSKGNRTVKVDTGNETHEVKGTRGVTVTGDETHTNKAKFTQNVTGDYSLKVSGNLTIDVTGSITIKSSSSISAEASTSFTNKAGTSLTNQAGTSLTNKAGTTLENNAGISLTNKASASQEVDGGGMLTLKGGMVKIN
ncbi:MAG TPA: type VI secretion system tip protein TssI/VgrG [Blastocatellia bacterium]|nr:type VI secretion system tip protein TssI/VgrG [Blastocatellia bacterium]